MDTKLRKFSHSIVTKIIVFIVMIGCLTTSMTMFFQAAKTLDGDIDVIFEESYYVGDEFRNETDRLLNDIEVILLKYKNKERILAGETIDKYELENKENILLNDFEYNSKYYNPNLSEEENYEKFKEIYADEINESKEELIQDQLSEYMSAIEKLETYKGIIYSASNEEGALSNIDNLSSDEDEYFKEFPAYLIIDGNKKEAYPEEIIYSDRYNQFSFSDNYSYVDKSNIKVYIGYTQEYLDSSIEEWEENKKTINDKLYEIGAFLLGFLLLFMYLILIIGRKSFRDKEVHLNKFDNLYNDINLVLCLGIVLLWGLLLDNLYIYPYNGVGYKVIIPITMIAVLSVFILIFSMVKHFKNRTLLKHTLIYTIFHKLFSFIKGVYDSGSIGVKIVVIAIVYPALVAASVFFFPITIGIGVWLAFKQVTKFNGIKEGVDKLKSGDLNYTINTNGKGELDTLALDINEIGAGLKRAVNNEVKSERLKTELITNVSHDIRTPLTSIISYIDLLKNEEDSEKREEYIEILEQKSQRLKALTDDLFQAAKATSGSIPVNLEKIDIVSLITQGLGEINDKITESGLVFKISQPENKVFITADGNLLWRAIENLLSNIFKYAVKGSRVYINIEDLGDKARITIKNMSAYELNISADELMERFKRGDESRSSEGSGLGLSIARSLVDIQKGSFKIEIDGDLFKAIIEMAK